MKIFSNFDTELPRRLYAEAVEKFWREHVLFVKRDKIYLVIRLFFPILLWLFLSSLLLLIFYWLIWTKSSFSEYAGFVTWGLVIAMFLFLLHYIWTKTVNYYLDFVIVTPKQVLMFDQAGILTRTTRALDTEKIKTINVVAQWWLSSVFSYGSMVFLAEGDMVNGEITLKFINKPVILRDRIYALIELHDKYKEDDE